MIARDEEDCLAACLQSARHLVREIIVVDTGSTDRTREVAVQNGAKVFSFPWRDDFAAARNYSLDLAREDWILVLDADEILAPVSVEAFARLLTAPDVEGYFVHIHNHLGAEERAPDQAVRLFKNHPLYRFDGSIHEQVAGAIKRRNRGGGLASSPLLIHHFGYLPERMAARDKHNRNIRVIKKALLQKPADPFLFYSLAIELFNCGENDRAVVYLERALSFMNGREGYLRDLLLLLCLALFKTGQRDKLLPALQKAMLILPGDADLHLLKGLALLNAEDYAPAAAELRASLQGTGILPAHCIHSLLGDVFSLMGSGARAGGEYFRALSLAPRLLYPLARIFALKQKGDFQPDWAALARFAPPAVRSSLRKQLLLKREIPITLALTLLTVLDAARGNGENPVTACRELVRLLTENPPAGNGPAVRCLLPAAQEMFFYAAAWARGFAGAWLDPATAVSSLAECCLELIAAEFAWPQVHLK